MAVHTIAAGRAWLYSHNIGRNGAAGMGFSMPIGVASAKDGVLYVANRGSDTNPNQRINKITIDHEFITEFGRVGPAYGSEEAGQFVWITSVALDKEENVYASDEWLNKVLVFDKEGKPLNTWGEAGDGEGQLNGPSGIAMDADDNLYIVNSLNSRIQKFSKDGHYLGGFGAIRFGRRALTEEVDRLLEMPLLGQGLGEAGFGLREIRFDLEGSAKMGDGRIQLSKHPVDDGEIGMGFFVLRVELNGPGVRVFGGSQIVLGESDFRLS